MRKIFILTLTISLLLLTAKTVAVAQELVITGNGADSTSSVVVKSGSIVTVVQTNEAEIKNIIEAKANTGGNQIEAGAGGTIKTGDSTTVVKVNNILNQNSTTVACCVSPTVAPTAKPNPTSTPVPPTAGPSSSGSSSSTSSSDSSTSTPGIGGAPVVLGLSNTASESALVQSLRLALGIVCVIISLGVLRSVRPV